MSLKEARRRIQEAYDTRATVLDLSGCDIDELPPEMQQLTWLEDLRADSDKGWERNGFSSKKGTITQLPQWIGYLTRLKVLKIRGQQLQSLVPELFGLPSLEHLNVSQNQLSELPPEIQHLTQLRVLIIPSNNIAVLPRELFKLTQIERLIIHSNKIMTLPVDIEKLIELKFLDIDGTGLTELPLELFSLTQIGHLDIRNNQLSELSSQLQNLVQLESLDVSNNQLTVVAPEIGRLTHLKSLNVRGNQLTAMPPEIGMLTNLTHLDVRDNQLTAVAPEIGRLTNLTQLHVNGNQLTVLPSEIGMLTHLEQLSVSENQLTAVPPEIGMLTYLKVLDVSNNQLTAVPPEIGMLTNLMHLVVSGNRLTSLPLELQYFSQLQFLFIAGNPLTIPSELIMEVFPERILSYLRQLGEGESRPLMEAKLILLGEGTVGKTSLVKRLMHDRYDPAECKTEGIAIERWPLPLEDGEVRLNVWDFGGQEIMHATHQFFLTKRSVYLLALNCRASDHENRLDYWLKLVQSFAPESPVIVVGNKADQHPLDLDQRGLMLKYPQIKAFVATSCEKGTGIAELRAEIVRQLGEMKHIRDVLPLSWWSVKQQLENLQRDYISHERFQDMCKDAGIDDEFVQKVLLGLLNDLGTVLSYHDDPRLAETNVLNPEWVTNGVYTLLNHAPLLEQRSGVLGVGELTAILRKHGDRYPATKCHFISEMMEKFELCFRIERDQWLIPDLLPREEPDTGGWDDALHFVYRYPVLPGSIISRFIVRSQHAIAGELRWRTGVVLQSGGNRAIVKADQEDARIDIRIDGDPANRRRFLSAIRHAFEQIHASLTGLRPEIQEFVPLPGHPGRLVDYEELLGLEALGDQHFSDGKLKQRFPLRQLLDGYESQTERQARQVDSYDDAPLDHLQALLETSQGHLRDYELQRAGFGGLHVPPYVKTQIDQLCKEIERIREAMERRRLRGGR